MKRFLLFTVALLVSIQTMRAQSPRKVLDFNRDWQFSMALDSLTMPPYPGNTWRTVHLPHDWSIEGSFDEKHPATNQGGALPTGIGWYRKIFVLKPGEEKKNISLEFDGVYRNSEVWVNGHYLGKRPNGYVSFSYDMNAFLKPAPQENLLVVKADNSKQPESRWYTGSGIYRDVRMVITHPVHIDQSRLFISTPRVSALEAIVSAEVPIPGENFIRDSFQFRISVTDPGGRKISIRNIQDVASSDPAILKKRITISSPALWSVDHPNLYVMTFQLIDRSGKVIDQVSNRFGIRHFHFDSRQGFFLNNNPLRIQGVCMHHDLGALGAAFNMDAARRQLRILKDMGCNAIRTAHNPPAPGFLDLCDEMGFLVMDEAFDMWQKRKNKFDYHLDFREWSEEDLASMVIRDRNHPSVFMWSIGNEIREQFDSSGTRIARELASIVRKWDSTRAVTAALTENIPDKNFIYRAGALDVLGFNYKLDDYSHFPERFPGQKILASETASALATRGVYDLPADSLRIWPPDSKPFRSGNKDWTVSAYDHAYAYWGATHEKAWRAVKESDFMAGCFVWSGFDFLGEPVPYPWPARSSYYGIIDLAGFPKDVYYMYQSEWTSKPVLHLFPHWNWKRGQVVDVWAYYSQAEEVELFRNGRSLGVRRKENGELHVTWKVPFEPGILRIVSRKQGKVILAKEIRTAGDPAMIELKADQKLLRAGKKNLVFVTVRVLDRTGNLVPDADNLVSFSISGEARIRATDNGYQADLESFGSPKRKCWKGMALVVLETTGKKGNIKLTANATGMKTSPLRLSVLGSQ